MALQQIIRYRLPDEDNQKSFQFDIRGKDTFKPFKDMNVSQLLGLKP